ncbi:hypothetical protein LguiB_017281 [Lonicera macranthoides]
MTKKLSKVDTVEASIQEIRGKLQQIDDRMQYLCNTITDFSVVNTQFQVMQQEQKSLQAQLEYLQKDQSPPNFPGLTTSPPTTGMSSTDLWKDIPKRRLPHWPEPKPKSKPKPKPKYAYIPKQKPQSHTPSRIITRNPDFDDMYLDTYRQTPQSTIQPLQHPNLVPPTPSFNKPVQTYSQKTSSTITPSAYKPQYDPTTGASSHQMDMLFVHNDENMPENQIASFLKTLAMNDRTPVKTTSSDLFANFDEVFMAEQVPRQQQQQPPPPPPQPPDPKVEPIIEDPSSSDSSDTEYVMPKIPPGEKYQQFTLNDIPPKKWRARFHSFTTWLQTDLQHYPQQEVFLRFLARLTGRLKDWYNSLGEYRQKTLQQQKTIDEFLGLIYIEFVGKASRHLDIMREELLTMKCCSLDMNDLEKHYDRISQRFYVLGGIDDKEEDEEEEEDDDDDDDDDDDENGAQSQVVVEEADWNSNDALDEIHHLAREYDNIDFVYAPRLANSFVIILTPSVGAVCGNDKFSKALVL